MSRKWHNVLRVSCKSPFNLVKLIEINVDLEDEFKKIENSFEWDEVVDTYNLAFFYYLDYICNSHNFPLVICLNNYFFKISSYYYYFLIIGLWQPPLKIDCYYICVNISSLKIEFVFFKNLIP